MLQFKTIFEGKISYSLENVVGHDRRQPGCHSEGLAQKGSSK